MTEDSARRPPAPSSPSVLSLALKPVLADLVYAGALPIKVVAIQRDHGTRWEVVVAVGVGETGLFVDTDTPLEEIIASLADQLQEPLIEEAEAAVPKCPLHEHPLAAQVRSGQAWWECPKSSDAWSCLIGELAEAGR